MKIKSRLFLTITFILMTNASSPLGPTDDLGQQPASPSTQAVQLSYIGQDGNVWFHAGLGSEPRQITTDRFHNESNDTPGGDIAYYFPRISSDGEWVAYRRDVTKSDETGMQYSSGLLLSHSKTNEVLQVLEQMPTGFAWKPGTHLHVFASRSFSVLTSCSRPMKLVNGMGKLE